MDEQVVNILLRAKDLIADGWTQGTMARNQYGDRVGLTSPKATHFCLTGALGRATYEELKDDRFLNEIYRKVAKQISSLTHWPIGKRPDSCVIPIYNDDRNTTKEGVLKILDETIVEEKAQ